MATYTTVDLSKANLVVSPGVSSVTLTAAGGNGGYGYKALAGPSYGAKIVATVPVSAGQVISGVLGGFGEDGKTSGSTAGGAPDGKPGNGRGGGGGGSSSISIDGTLVLKAPGGGGCSNPGTSLADGNEGGAGGYPNGANGSAAAGGTAGTGATQTAAGTGTLGTNGGGGGGGLFAGGSGTNGGAGGGGSGFVGPGLTVVSVTPDGPQIRVTYKDPVTPTAPTIVSPTAGSWVGAGTVRLRFQYPMDDVQSGALVQWRPVGGDSTDVTITDATNFADVTLTPGDYEWRVQVTSGDGLTGPFAAWTPFSTEIKPAAPVLTSPSDDDVLVDLPVPIEWTGAASAWQAQIVGPNGVIWDSGTQSGTDTSVTGSASVDKITVKVQVRLRAAHVYSDWASVTCTVAWVGPVAPVVSLAPDPAAGCIRIGWTQPETDPAVDHYEVVAVEDGTEFLVPGASALDASLRSFVFRLPRSDVDTAIRVSAVAASGAATTTEVR